MRNLRLLTLPVLAMLALAGCEWEEIAPSNRYKEDFSYTYDMKPGGRLDVENFNGAVEIYGWDKNSIEIQGSKYASTKVLLDSLRIDVTPSPEAVRIRTVRPSERRGNMGARYIIHVPRRTALDRIISSNGALRIDGIEGLARVKTSNGPVRALNLHGDLDATTSNGAVELQEFQGAAVVATSNGPVRASGVRGHFEATTSNGPVDVELADLKSDRPVKVRSSNGPVRISLAGSKGPDVYASTSNGPITVKLPSNAAARVKAVTSNSSIASEFDVAAEGAQTKTRIEGSIGGGGSLLDLSTSNGSIKLVKN